MISMRNRSMLSIADFSSDELAMILHTAAVLKRQPSLVSQLAVGKTLAMLFEKPSLRTRVTFEVAMTQMGGHAIYLPPSDIGLGTREPAKDIARNLSRWCQVIMARTYQHATLVELAEFASIPVINALSDREHPCQALADFLTFSEHKSNIKGRKLTFVGDGNNVAQSLMLLAAKLGTNFSLACPEGYAPAPDIMETARACAAASGATIIVSHDPQALVEGADVIYTDVWTSMGQEEERAARLKVFPPYQVNARLLSRAKQDAIVMHCLPAHRGEEISEEVLEGPQSVVLDEAENRLHVQKAVLALALGWSLP